MAHGDARERKRSGNWRMEWVASTLHTTSEHGVSTITTADAHTSAASSRLNWRPRRFKWFRPFRRKTKSGFCVCAVTFQLASNYLNALITGHLRERRMITPDMSSSKKVDHQSNTQSRLDSEPFWNSLYGTAQFEPMAWPLSRMRHFCQYLVIRPSMFTRRDCGTCKTHPARTGNNNCNITHSVHCACNLWPTSTQGTVCVQNSIYLLTAIGLSPGGSITVHIYTEPIHRKTQITTNLEECGPSSVFESFTLKFVLQLRKKHGKPSVRVQYTYYQNTHTLQNIHITHTHTNPQTHTHTHTHANSQTHN